MPSGQVDHRERGALIGYVHQVRAAPRAKQLGNQMAVRARAGRTIRNALWRRLGQRHELGKVLRFDARMHYGDDGRAAEQGYVREVLHRIERGFRHRRADRVRGNARDEQGITVSRSV